jgi:hypothetical protein
MKFDLEYIDLSPLTDFEIDIYKVVLSEMKRLQPVLYNETLNNGMGTCII